MGELKGTKALVLWSKRIAESYPGVTIENMTTSWRDGLAFCAIIHHFRPDLIDFSSLKKDDIYNNNELAFRVAENELGIPALLEPKDMVECTVPDRLSILTYLSQFYRAFAGSQSNSPTKSPTKRLSPTETHTRNIVAGPSSSPMKKVGARRDTCAKCGLPVFITQRLNVGKLLYHSTCFRCASCNNNATLESYYETEDGHYCCKSSADKSNILKKSLSDEDKSAELKEEEEEEEQSSKEDFYFECSEKVMNNARYSSNFEYLPQLQRESIASVYKTAIGENLCSESTDSVGVTSPSLSSDCDDSKLTANQIDVTKDSTTVDDVVVRHCPSGADDCEILYISDEFVTNVNSDIVPSKIDIEHREIDDSIIVISSDSSDEEEAPAYPDDLNPFGVDDEEENEKPSASSIKSLNPFGDTDEDDENDQEKEAPQPAPRLSLLPKKSTNPFEEDEDEEEPKPLPHLKKLKSPRVTLTPVGTEEITDKKKLKAPKFSLSPFWNDEEDDAVRRSASKSSPGGTGRKKQPAPKPPTVYSLFSEDTKSLADSSVASSPSSSVSHSPKSLRKARKTRRAPLPPMFTSTPTTQKEEPATLDGSNLSLRTTSDENLKGDREDYGPSSLPEKNTLNKYRRKKMYAPLRPLLQRRYVQSLPNEEIENQLCLIKQQLQGLEKQGVTLEKSIREKTEAPGINPDDSLSPDIEEKILQLFEVVNERNELLRKQTELMYIRRQHRLEEEHAEIEYKIRQLMLQPETSKTDVDKCMEEELIKKLLENVEQRNEIVDCLEMARRTAAVEDSSIQDEIVRFTTSADKLKSPTSSAKKKSKKTKSSKSGGETKGSDNSNIKKKSRMKFNIF